MTPGPVRIGDAMMAHLAPFSSSIFDRLSPNTNSMAIIRKMIPPATRKLSMVTPNTPMRSFPMNMKTNNRMAATTVALSA